MNHQTLLETQALVVASFQGRRNARRSETQVFAHLDAVRGINPGRGMSWVEF